MRLALLLVALLLTMGIAQGGQVSESAGERTAPGIQPPPIDVDRLPISIDRIKRELAQERPSPDGLRLKFYIDVYGRAPTIDLFRDFDLDNGPVPFSAPTHAEFLQLVTPQEFRAPAVDLGMPLRALLQWLTGADRRGKRQ